MPLTRRAISLRLPADLWAAVEARAEKLGQTRTKFVERALEEALAPKQGTDGSPSPGGSSAPPRASTSPSLARFRQS